MADKTLVQQQLATLNDIDQLADPTLDEDKVWEIYRKEEQELTVLLKEKVQVDEETATLLKKASLNKDLATEDTRKLQNVLFTALIVKEGNLTAASSKEKGASQNTALGFAESYQNINVARRKAYEEKQKTNSAFIEQVVNKFSQRLHLTSQQKEEFRKQFTQREQQLEKMSHYQPLDPQIYVKEADAIVATILPKEDYLRERQALIYRTPADEHLVFDASPRRTHQLTPTEQQERLFDAIYDADKDLQTSYNRVVEHNRQENLYRELGYTVLSQQKEVTIRPDKAFVHIAPYVALEGAVAIISKEKPQAAPQQIIDEALPTSRAMMAFQGLGGNETTPELVNAVQALIYEREGFRGLQRAADKISAIQNSPNSHSILLEAYRKDLQAGLLAIVNDNQTMKNIFGEIVNSDFVSSLSNTIKSQANNTPGNMSGILSAASGIVADTATTVTSTPLPPEKNPALLFIQTSERLGALKDGNKKLYDRFSNMFHPHAENLPHPQSGREAFVTLALLTTDPHGPMNTAHLHSLASRLPGAHSSPMLSLLGSLSHTVSGSNLAQRFISKVYLSYFFSLNPDFASESLRAAMYNLFSQSMKGVYIPAGTFSTPATGALLSGGSGGLGKGLGMLGNIAAKGGIQNAVLAAAGSFLGNSAKRLLSGDFFKNMFAGGNMRATDWVTIVPVIFIVLFLIVIPTILGSPSLIQEELFSTMIGEDPLKQGVTSPSEITPGCYKDSNQIVLEAQKILAGLQKGIWKYWNYHPEYPQYAKYSSIAFSGGKIEGQDPTRWYDTHVYDLGIQQPPDLFWCTWLVSIAYKKAGAPAPFTASVVGAYRDWNKYGGKIVSRNVNPLEVPLGSAIFFDKGTRNLAHIGLVCDRFINNSKDGSITTCESNSGMKQFTYNVVGGVIQDARLSGSGQFLTVDSYGFPPTADPTSPTCQEGPGV